MPLYCKGRCERNLFRKGKGQETRGRQCLLVPSHWTFLRKKKTRSRGNRGRKREGMQGYALGTLWEKPFRKGMEASDRRMSCLLGPSYWTFLRKKEDKRERKRVNRMGRKARLCPYIARSVVGETF